MKQGKLLGIKIGDKYIKCETDIELKIETNEVSEKVKEEEMTFKESLDILGISEHIDKIWNSSSTGELFYIAEYIHYAKEFKRLGLDNKEFAKAFNEVVNEAYSSWKRPISIYQHVLKVIFQPNTL